MQTRWSCNKIKQVSWPNGRDQKKVTAKQQQNAQTMELTMGLI